MKTIKNIDTSATPIHITEWSTIDWNKINEYVRRLRQRIFRAEQLGQQRKVRKLQRLMLRSKANLLLSIKKVTQVNKGKKTAGLDSITVLTPRERTSLFNALKDYSIKLIKPVPAKRIYILKKNGKQRPLGIPVIKDRIYQNIVKNSLEPQWESRFEATSYGFRPKRSTFDAIANIFTKLCQKTCRRQWIFEGDFKGCFDNLNHGHILAAIGNFPYNEVIYKWLKAGYVDENVFTDTEFGTPQGSVISPLLANIALHGIEEAIGVKYVYSDSDGYSLNADSPAIVRFADDFVILCQSEDKANSMFGKLKPYLLERGLTLAEDKTKITHVCDGFDFLGFNIRKYKTNNGMKLLIKPSKSSIKKATKTIKDKFNDLRGCPVGPLIIEINPIIRGIGNYWSSVVAKKTFCKIDNYVFLKMRKHIRQLHPNKSRKWKTAKYFKADYTGVSKQKIATDPHNPKNQLFKMSWIPIQRHVLIKFKNSPDDVTLEDYFAKRDEKEFSRFNALSKRKIAKNTCFKCRVCSQSLVGEEKLICNNIIPKELDGFDTYTNLELLHKSCYEQHQFLMEKYGGGKNLPKIREYFNYKNIEPSSKDGINLMKKQFKRFKYTNCSR
jgi:RNA-directed DNA polymerase